MRLIDADAFAAELRDKANDATYGVELLDDYYTGLKSGFNTAALIAERYPTIEAELTEEQIKEYCRKRCLTIITDDVFLSFAPVRHGEWIEVQTGKWHGWKCSECGKIVRKKTKLKWCFNCGAQMGRRE